MIVVDEGDYLLIITQPDHARFAAELLSLWRANGLPEHPRRGDLLFAVREHDNGWQEADSAPWVDPSRLRPYDFVGYPLAARREIWQRGILRHADRHPLTALLIAEHAEAIHRPLDVEWQELLDAIEPQRLEWLRAIDIERQLVHEDYRWLRLADSLSLAFCTQRSAFATNLGIEARIDTELLQIEPFPLAGGTTFKIPARRIPNRPYPRDSVLGSELARARWDELSLRVTPFSPPIPLSGRWRPHDSLSPMVETLSESGIVAAEHTIEPTRIRIPSPIGTLGIELTGNALTQIVIVPKGRERDRFRAFADLKRSERSDFLDEVLGRFSEYFAGARKDLGLDYDLKSTGVSGFSRRVLRKTAKIPYGRTRTYREIAESAGNPDGYRQVLSTLAVNPLPLIIPCHRVTTSKSGIGSYIAGVKKKNWLLRLEKRTLAAEDL